MHKCEKCSGPGRVVEVLGEFIVKLDCSNCGHQWELNRENTLPAGVGDMPVRALLFGRTDDLMGQN